MDTISHLKRYTRILQVLLVLTYFCTLRKLALKFICLICKWEIVLCQYTNVLCIRDPLSLPSSRGGQRPTWQSCDVETVIASASVAISGSRDSNVLRSPRRFAPRDDAYFTRLSRPLYGLAMTKI
jgi:hypothetical protein